MKKYTLVFSETFMQSILDNDVSKVVQFSFPKGKELPNHKTSLEKEIEHSIVALEDSIVVLVLTPSPRMHSVLKPNQ